MFITLIALYTCFPISNFSAQKTVELLINNQTDSIINPILNSYPLKIFEPSINNPVLK